MSAEKPIDERYWAHCWPDDSELATWLVIPDAESITLPGWEHLDLCLHQWLHYANAPEVRLWTITEGHSGTWIATGGTVADVRMEALRLLNGRGLRKINARIRQDCSDWGTSPRYETPRSGADFGQLKMRE